MYAFVRQLGAIINYVVVGTCIHLLDNWSLYAASTRIFSLDNWSLVAVIVGACVLLLDNWSPYAVVVGTRILLLDHWLSYAVVGGTRIHCRATGHYMPLLLAHVYFVGRLVTICCCCWYTYTFVGQLVVVCCCCW